MHSYQFSFLIYIRFIIVIHMLGPGVSKDCFHNGPWSSLKFVIILGPGVPQTCFPHWILSRTLQVFFRHTNINNPNKYRVTHKRWDCKVWSQGKFKLSEAKNESSLQIKKTMNVKNTVISEVSSLAGNPV